MRLLVSVRDRAEALLAAQAGAGLIDLKEPSRGALGALPTAQIAAIVALLRARGHRQPISATIGDWPAAATTEILEGVAAVAACGVTYVKVGIERGPAAPALLDALARCGHAVVPVLLADDGIDDALVARALGRFAALMLDTARKRGGGLLQRVTLEALSRFVAQVRAQPGMLCGLAGSLRLEDLPQLHALAPDFAGFRGAVCAGAREGTLDSQRLQALLSEHRRLDPAQARRSA